MQIRGRSPGEAERPLPLPVVPLSFFLGVYAVFAYVLVGAVVSFGALATLESIAGALLLTDGGKCRSPGATRPFCFRFVLALSFQVSASAV